MSVHSRRLYLVLIWEIYRLSEATTQSTEANATPRKQDVLCFSCAGVDCPVSRYTYPVEHMTLGCTACSKQWLEGKEAAIRKCISATENANNDTGEYCKTEDSQKGREQCVCLTDYCNGSSRMRSFVTCIFIVAVVFFHLSK